VPLPEQIPVTFTEEDAQYLTVRPVRRQSFRPPELVDMIVRVTGKNAGRVLHILRTGSLVFHFYRYRWNPIELSEQELGPLLAGFADPDPSREFRQGECTVVLAVPPATAASPGSGDVLLPPVLAEFHRDAAQKKRLFSARGVWDVLMEPAIGQRPAYAGYSYARQADVYRLELSRESAAALALAAAKLAPRDLRALVAKLQSAGMLLFLCPRG